MSHRIYWFNCPLSKQSISYLKQKICNFLVVGPYTANLPDRPKLPYGFTL